MLLQKHLKMIVLFIKFDWNTYKRASTLSRLYNNQPSMGLSNTNKHDNCLRFIFHLRRVLIRNPFKIFHFLINFQQFICVTCFLSRNSRRGHPYTLRVINPDSILGLTPFSGINLLRSLMFINFSPQNSKLACFKWVKYLPFLCWNYFPHSSTFGTSGYVV